MLVQNFSFCYFCGGSKGKTHCVCVDLSCPNTERTTIRSYVCVCVCEHIWRVELISGLVVCDEFDLLHPGMK